MCGPADHHTPMPTGSAPASALVAGRYHLRGHVLPDGDLRDVYVVDGRITFEPVPDAETVVDDGWLVPGLVDSHAHLALASPAGPHATPAEQIEASARAQLSAGVLLVREPGGPDRGSSRIGPELGLPRTVTAGRFLAPPGGYFPGLAREVEPKQLAAAVAEEAAAGTGWVKLIGDYPRDSARLTPNWDADSLAAAVTAAHTAGARITVHAITPEAIADAVDAGVDAIEHGTGMPPDLLATLAARGTTWVPTLIISDGIRQWARDAMAPAEWPAVDNWVDALPSTVAAAASGGVRVLAGTDAGMVPHGMVASEVRLLIEAGVSGSVAIAAASWNARRYLGLPSIEEGAPADIVAFPDDPRADPETLFRHTVTILDGRQLLAAPVAVPLAP